MQAVKFKESNAVLGKDQAEYLPLHAHIDSSDWGIITTCWKISVFNRLKLLFTGKVWHQSYTFRQPIQPILLTTKKPEMNNE